MCDPSELNIPDFLLEQLRCAICTEYLTCLPIQVLPNGNNVCGNCRSSESEGSSYRNSTLEAIISKVYFPCKYKEFGCKERLLFNETKEHENDCNYHGFPCPATECLWKGPLRQVPKHFSPNHPLRYLQFAQFELELKEDKEEILMVHVDDVHFIWKYKYNAAARELYYDVRYIELVQEVTYKIRMMNKSDEDYSVTAKGNQCQIYDYDFNNPEIANILIISNFLPVLNNATAIIMSIDFRITKLELLRCETCKNYLTIPIYDDGGVNVCVNCIQSTSTLTIDKVLVRRVVGSLIPCRWDGCPVKQFGDKIREHERTCKKRVYYCIIPDCNDSFDHSRINFHFNIHSLKKFYFSSNSVVNFSKMSKGENYIYTRIGDEIIVVKTETCRRIEMNFSYVRFTLLTSEYANNIKGTVVFSHSHCTKQFDVTKVITIYFVMLPKCFDVAEDVTVTILIQ